jgi:hypothetical protein
VAKPSGLADATAGGLSEFVRQSRAHFEIERETIDGPSGRTLSGFGVRLFAMHERAPHSAPGCPVCWRVAAALRRVASAALLANPVEGHVHIAPLEPVLYQSRQAPGSDEVAITVHLRPPEPSRVNPERWLQDIRGRLNGLGVVEQ